MAITQAMTTSFKAELLLGVHDFRPSADTGADVFKLALYTSSASLDANTTAYTSSDEVSSVGTNYTAGGATLTPVAPTSSGTTAYISFSNVSWSNASFTARGALIYNSTTGAAVCVLNFGSDKTCSNQTFTVTFPTAGATSAILRIA